MIIIFILIKIVTRLLLLVKFFRALIRNIFLA